jgi:hypothetical protein
MNQRKRYFELESKLLLRKEVKTIRFWSRFRNRETMVAGIANINIENLVRYLR